MTFAMEFLVVKNSVILKLKSIPRAVTMLMSNLTP
jgi:hypothetical protein